MSPHLHNDDLVLAFYGELAAPHLDECAECQARLEALKRDLGLVDAPVPERNEAYGVWVWHRLRPRLRQRQAPRWAAISAVALLVIGAFAFGRWTAQAPVVETARVAKPARALRASLGDHLERTHLVLAEIENGDANAADFANDRERAEALLTPNRLYREAARQAGDPNAAQVLEDLERVLLEIVHSPEQVSREEFDELRNRIRDRGLVLRIKVVEEEYQEEPELEPIQQ